MFIQLTQLTLKQKNTSNEQLNDYFNKKNRTLADNPCKFTLLWFLDKRHNYNFGNSELSHNPILNPQNNINYNKYLRLDNSGANMGVSSYSYSDKLKYGQQGVNSYGSGSSGSYNSGNTGANEIVRGNGYEYTADQGQRANSPYNNEPQRSGNQAGYGNYYQDNAYTGYNSAYTGNTNTNTTNTVNNGYNNTVSPSYQPYGNNPGSSNNMNTYTPSYQLTYGNSVGNPQPYGNDYYARNNNNNSQMNPGRNSPNDRLRMAGNNIIS
jgi:hypothetical protein